MKFFKFLAAAMVLPLSVMSNAQLVSLITFNDLTVGQVVEPTHYLSQGVVLYPQPTGYLYGASSNQSTGQALWVNGNGVDQKEISVNFFVPGSDTPGVIDEFYTLIRAPGSWTVEYWGPNGEFFGRFSSNDAGVGTTFAQGMHPHRLFFYGAVPWSDISLDDFQFSSIEAVPEPATMAVLGLGLLAFIKRRRKR